VALQDVAATDAVLSASLGALAVGAVLLLPSLWWLYTTFQTAPAPPPDASAATHRPRNSAPG